MVLQWFQVRKIELEGSNSTIAPGIDRLKIKLIMMLKLENCNTT